MFDGVVLPFGDAPLGRASSTAEEVRWMAFARDLVLQELQSTPSTAQEWADATASSQVAQREHYQTYLDFIRHMQERLPCAIGIGSPSPISGAVRPTPGRYRCGLLDRVEVAEPPASLWCAATLSESMRCAPSLRIHEGPMNEDGEKEEPLLSSSSTSVTEGMTQMVASQTSLDGVFFEGLLSQELNLALWRRCGLPQEALRCALEEVQRLDRAACEEDAVLRYLNTMRFTEQRVYKRRRAEMQSQLNKTREKVVALERSTQSVKMSRGSTTPPLPCPQEHVFINAQGEPFHCTTFSPSSWSPPSNPAHDPRTPLLLCVHGAGMSGDCFFRMAREIQLHTNRPSDATANDSSSSPRTSDVPPLPTLALEATVANAEVQGDDMDVHVMTYDQRCHGRSTFVGGEAHLSIEVLIRDFLDVLQYAKTELYPTSNIYVLGHSLGGAVVARALSGNKASLERVSGVVLVDVVEGTAQLSLQHMKAFLKNRPNSFPEVKDAEVWFLGVGGMHNPEGAEVSVPPLLQKNEETGLWQWRTDISKMESVWDRWFTGLDEAFIALPCAKMLCTANAERLDKTLTVAQMQGKFQFEVIGNGCGHYVMDDATPTVVAKVLRFVKRNEVLTQKLLLMNRQLSGQTNNTMLPPKRL